ncbi:Na+/H+ antiporter NhaA [Hydrogenophaga sp. PBC]|uniref:Na+/H+ antiporter NhaA n=1 Tax=Hydrogenophaga sp. PBC TaxID=795665 RepID=UPI000260708A|nr:Na+/H+ antiporter NhaA [Hydrogenophaga sp. PBC]
MSLWQYFHDEPVVNGYSHGMDWGMLALAALCIAILRLLAGAGVRSVSIYVVMGAATWLAIDAAGLHATVTGVILGLMTPATRWVSDNRLYAILGQVIAHPTGSQGSGRTSDRKTLLAAETAARESLSPVERLEMALHPWVSFGVMPVFALANAGLALSWTNVDRPVAAAVFFGFALGKPAGILLFGWLALRSGLATRPGDLGWGAMAGGSCLAGIGFTMALFIANLALSGPLMDSAKIGIFLASLFSAAVGLALLRWTQRPLPLEKPSQATESI